MKRENSEAKALTVKLEYTEAKVIRVTAHKTLTFTSPDATKCVTVQAGEVFYLVKAESLEDGRYYVVTYSSDRLYGNPGFCCHCPSYRQCKHEVSVNAHNMAYHMAKQAAKVLVVKAVAAPVVKTKPVLPLPKATGSEIVRGSLNGSRAFNFMRC